MGSCQSTTAADKGKVYKEDLAEEAGEYATGAYPRPLFKASKLFAPPKASAEDGGPLPAMILVHGSEFESEMVADAIVALAFSKTGLRADWQYMTYLAREVAKQGVICMVIGLPDNDAEVMLEDFPDLSEEKKKAIRTGGMLTNNWSGNYYSKALSAAIDHLIAVSPKHLGLQVDTERVAIAGHSLGGGGVLCAAAADCATRIKAVVALNPSLFSPSEPYESLEPCKKYTTGKKFSGEFGEDGW